MDDATVAPTFIVSPDNIDSIVTDAVVAEYWERGYWTSPKLLSDDAILRLRAAHARLWAGDFDHEIASQYGPPKPQADPGDLRQQCNAFWLNDEIRRVVTSPVLGRIGARLMRSRRALLWHDQAILKPGADAAAGCGAKPNVGWHQDYAYWQCCDTTNMVTAWVALQDTDLDNGGMRTIVGSHRWGLIPESNQFFAQNLDGDAARFAAIAKGDWIDEPCVLPAGAASFHHALTFHGSGANQRPEPRLSVVAHMMPDGAAYRSGRLKHPNMVFLGPDARDGQKFEGPYWPQMWPPLPA